jgi:hypothetical protein
MRKEVKLFTVFSVVFIALVPLCNASMTSSLSKEKTQENNTTPLLCSIGKQKIVKELPVSTIDALILLGESKKNDFLTIYNKYATQEEVANAFDDLQPFFNALVANGLTDKSVEDLNTLFHEIRGMIKKPRHDPFGPQPAGSWNGLPTFLVANAACGIFCGDAPAVGFALGTHTVLPTIGADAFITWAGNGETVSIGGLGFTTSTGPEFGIVFGFIGVLLATPIMIVGGMFMTGFAALYVGIGPAPF